MYYKHTVALSNAQLKKIKVAHDKKQAVNLRIDPSLRGNHTLYLTTSQIKQLQSGKPKDIKLSVNQLTKNGGFLFTIPLILAGISAAAGVAGATSTIVKNVQSANTEKAMTQELQRHNAVVEGNLKGQETVTESFGKEGSGLFQDVIQHPLTAKIVALAVAAIAAHNLKKAVSPKEGKGSKKARKQGQGVFLPQRPRY